MTLDPRTPVIVGVAQVKQQPTDLTTTVEPLDLMAQAMESAQRDAGNGSLLNTIDQLAVVQGAWSYSDPARLLAERFGSASTRTLLSGVGGQTPQALVNLLSRRIEAGEADVAVIVGAETIWSRRRRKRAGLDVPKTEQKDIEPDERAGADVEMSTSFEIERGLANPINFYPVFESAIRASRHESIEDHRSRISQLWAGFNQVAVGNEQAWNRTALSPSEIRNASPSNRMVGFPYTKAMNSNWDLDQGAAIVLCSAERAEALGIDRDRWIFPWAGAEAHDTYAVSNRRDLHSSPAIEEAGKALFAMADVGVDDLDHLDLYSCFPSAVQVAADALGLDQSRRLTLTGGLTFAGGPLNNYVSHSIASMASTLRAEPDQSLGLVTANGGYLTKHALGLYSNRPPEASFRFADVQETVDAVEGVECDETYHGNVSIEAYTVMHDREGPEVGLCALRTPTNQRTWGRVEERETLESMMSDEAIGSSGVLLENGRLELTS